MVIINKIMITILTELTKDKRTRTQKLRRLHKNNPELWEEIVDKTKFLPSDASAPQRVWHIMNDIYEVQVCEITGGKVNWIGFDNGYCKHTNFATSRKNVGEKVRKTVAKEGHWRKDKKKAKKANKKFSEGRKNGEHKKAVLTEETIKLRTEKIKETCLERYGVDNYRKTPEMRKFISELIYQRNIANGATPRELRDERRLYYEEVAFYTEKSWCEHFYKINPDRKHERGPEFHLDHIFSRQQGFIQGIPPEIIGHWTNLRLLPRVENSSKRDRCDKTKEQLFEDFYKDKLA